LLPWQKQKGSNSPQKPLCGAVPEKTRVVAKKYFTARKSFFSRKEWRQLPSHP